jgi:hypothetical protein
MDVVDGIAEPLLPGLVWIGGQELLISSSALGITPNESCFAFLGSR